MSAGNETVGDGRNTCKDGLLVGALPTSRSAALAYLAALLYCFLGTAIVADVFMQAIEVITSAKRKVRLPPARDESRRALVEDGATKSKDREEAANQEEPRYRWIRVWNPTVANLTLMALGSSAPEILLSIIEVVGNGFRAGDLGPGTIVGSAAFNLFCISALCVVAVPSPDGKRIEAFAVFLTTSIFATFAYVWLLLVLVFISKDRVDVWEAAVTLGLFVLLVAVSYAADVKLWRRAGAGGGRLAKDGESVPEETALSTLGQRSLDATQELDYSLQTFAADAAGQEPVADYGEPSPADVKCWAKKIARHYPWMTAADQAKLLAYKISQFEVRSRLYYRIRAARQMAGSSIREEKVEEEARRLLENEEIDGSKSPVDAAKSTRQLVEWSARVYAVNNGDKAIKLKILRHGPLDGTLRVNYQTANGSARRDLHFHGKSETIQLESGQGSATVELNLVNTNEWRAGQTFYVHLKLADSGEDQDDEEPDQEDAFRPPKKGPKLGECAVARVRMPDSTAQAAGMLGQPTVEFVKLNYVVKENAGTVRLYVTRKGSKVAELESLKVLYSTEAVTATAGIDFVPVKGAELQFDDAEWEKPVDIVIVDDKEDEKDETFTVELDSVVGEDRVVIGAGRRAVVSILSDDNVIRNVLHLRRLVGHYRRKLRPFRQSWTSRLASAVSLDEGQLAGVRLRHIVHHLVALPWKLAAALAPPPQILGGWPCFLVALALIGFITALIGDLASIFGCMAGLRDSITAITLVALGTSLPDTFASMIAAKNDATADNAVGNVTGSNSVNVYLGLGLPWLLASVYWARKGKTFDVPAGDLGRSVLIYTICSLLFFALLSARRRFSLFGSAELGGPAGTKFASALFFFLLWVAYVALSIWGSG